MISKKQAQEKLKRIGDEYSSGTMNSSLDKAKTAPLNCGHKIKRKPTLDELDRRG